MSAPARPLTPFDFRPDFAPQVSVPGEVRLTAEEVAALISKVRADTLAEVSRQETQETLDRLDRVTATMREALGDLLQVMQVLDSSGFDEATEKRLRGTINGLAQRMIDGQGDLFGLTRDLSTKLDNSPSNRRRMGQ